MGVPTGTEYHQGLRQTLFLRVVGATGDCYSNYGEQAMLSASGGTDPKEDTTSTGEAEVLKKLRPVEETSLMCLRGSFVCLCIGEVVEDGPSEVSKRVSLGEALGPFPYSRGGAREGNHSAQEKLAAVELHFLIPISLLKGVLRQNGSITKRCVSS